MIFFSCTHAHGVLPPFHKKLTFGHCHGFQNTALTMNFYCIIIMEHGKSMILLNKSGDKSTHRIPK